MSSAECPLRLTCDNGGLCDRTGIVFDTLHGYPAVLYDGERRGLVDAKYVREGVFPEPQIDGESVFAANETLNAWGLPLCTGAGAVDGNGNLYNPSEDLPKIDALDQAIRGNTWEGSLEDAVEAAPSAPWAPAFLDEIERRSRHLPYSPVQPCNGCEFGGQVTALSPKNVEITAQASGNDVSLRFVENGHRTGEVVTAVYGDTRDEAGAVFKVTSAVRSCRENGIGMVTGTRARIFGIGVGAVQACGALCEVTEKGVVRPKFGIREVINSQETPAPGSE